MFKAHQNNSLFYSGMSQRAFLKRSGMNISQKTFSHYFTQLKELGFLRQQGKHTEIISWEEILRSFDVPFNKTRLFKRLGNIQGKSITEVTNLVIQEACMHNFEAQQYFIDKRQQQKQDFLRGKGRRVKEAARKQVISVGEYLDSISKRTKIVTGSYHLASKFGTSRMTINRVLNQMHKEGKICRKIIRERMFEGQVNHSTYDLMKSQEKIFWPTPSFFLCIRGSEISI
jgi:ribosomal protein S25